MHVVCAWIGNTEPVAVKYYLQINDGHFQKVAGAAQNAAHQGAETSGIKGNTESRGMQQTPINAGECGNMELCECAGRESNPQPSASEADALSN